MDHQDVVDVRRAVATEVREMGAAFLVVIAPIGGGVVGRGLTVFIPVADAVAVATYRVLMRVWFRICKGGKR